MRRMSYAGPGARDALAGACALLLLAACGRGEDPHDARDVTESGSAADVIGRPPGADTIPPEMEDRHPEPPLPAESLPPAAPPDDSLRRPERRPLRDIPPLTRPDSGRP